jgi:hypothetical protein
VSCGPVSSRHPQPVVRSGSGRRGSTEVAASFPGNRTVASRDIRPAVNRNPASTATRQPVPSRLPRHWVSCGLNRQRRTPRWDNKGCHHPRHPRRLDNVGPLAGAAAATAVPARPRPIRGWVAAAARDARGRYARSTTVRRGRKSPGGTGRSVRIDPS